MKRKFMLLALLVGVMVTAPFMVPKARAQAAAPRQIVIVAKRFSYDPGEITLKKGQPVVLVLKSMDVAHGLRIRDFKVNVKVKAGGTQEVQFTPDKTGDFIGHCSVFCGSGHGSMTLKLHVVE
ncbi:MAG: cupredoxin domain-containing protein [Acidobacteriaceae bacterium]